MFSSRMYKEYYPIKNRHDLFAMNEKDRSKLVKWINDFNTEIHAGEFTGQRYGRPDWYFPLLYQLSQEDYDKLRQKLATKSALCELEDKVVIQIINAVLYMHKYNAVISFFAHPLPLYEIGTGEQNAKSSR